MQEVRFHERAGDALLKFAVIICKYQGKWIFCKHKERNTWEIPGGHREPGEEILATAKRELYEETGAVSFDICPVCVYSVLKDSVETFGMLYYANVTELEGQLHSEIERIELFDKVPNNLTYPLIQPLLLQELERRNKEFV